ncbi:MAG TPA: IgGFc-binding protein [Polyangia bacterium]
MRHLRVAAALGLGMAAPGLGCASPRTPIDAATLTRDAGADTAPTCSADCAKKGQVCSLDRCTSSACATAELSGQNIVGCLFYSLQADNVTADDGAQTTFLVTNFGVDPANVELEVMQLTSDGADWASFAGRQIAVNASASLPISAHEVTAAGLTRQAALRISSDRPVTVAEIESDDLQSVATSSGGTMILPLRALGVGYQAVTYPQHATADVAATDGSRGGAGRVIVVGTRDGTSVTFTPRTSVTGDPNGVLPDLTALYPYMFTLDDGDVFQIYTGAEGEDLTGGTVTASAPVAVFSGNISTTYGSNATGINSADMAHEQMPPVSAWSRSWVAAALTPQASVGCTSFFDGAGASNGAGASIWEVVASRDDTAVTVSVPGMADQTKSLAAGAPWTIVQPGSFYIHATYPILVTQGMDCEASLSLAVAVVDAPLFKNLPFAVPPSFDLLLGIVRPAGAEVDLDGMPIAEGMFQPAGGGFDVAAVTLAPCFPNDGSGACTHQLSSPVGLGMTLRGMDVGSSFALTPPLLVDCDPGAELCLN